MKESDSILTKVLSAYKKGHKIVPVTIVEKNACAPSVGMSFRSCRPGPEHDLVEKFLVNCVSKIPRGCKVTIFREPRIETGFPDLVLVVWHVATTMRWNPLRANLTKEDIRLMHYLVRSGATSHDGLLPLPFMSTKLS